MLAQEGEGDAQEFHSTGAVAIPVGLQESERQDHKSLIIVGFYG